MKILQDIRRAKERGSTVRPLWQIAVLIPLWPVYALARKFVDWMDGL